MDLHLDMTYEVDWALKPFYLLTHYESLWKAYMSRNLTKTVTTEVGHNVQNNRMSSPTPQLPTPNTFPLLNSFKL